MKRSKTVRLARFQKKPQMATAAVLSASMAISGCGSSDIDTAQIYNNVEECVQQYPDQPMLCQEVFGQAIDEHLSSAPRFTDLAACEFEFGAELCEVAPEGSEGNPEGGSWFMPMMMGYMMGSMFSSGSKYPKYAPVYRSNSKTSSLGGKLFTANGTILGKQGAKTVSTLGGAAFNKSSSPTRVSSVGGFGKIAAAKSASVTRLNNSSKSRSFGG